MRTATPTGPAVNNRHGAPVSIAGLWPQVRAVSLDLDDTLWPIAPVIERAERQLLAWLEREFPHIAADYCLDSMRNHRDGIAQRFPEISHDVSAQRRKALECLLQDHGVLDAEIEQAARRGWRVFYSRRNEVEWYDDAGPLLQRLHGHYRLAATTNGNADLDATGARRWIPLAVRAGEAGHAKPAAGIWRLLAGRLGLAPERILHVGDHPEEDILGASRHGHPVIWLNRNGEAWKAGGDPPVTIRSLHQLQP